MYSLFAFIFENSFLFRGVLLFVLGAIVGSFLNVVIYRLPIILKCRWKEELRGCLDENSSIVNQDCHHTFATFNFFYPTSHCTHCQRKVPIWANIPLFGYFVTKGKCYFCKKAISCTYPLVEIITATLFTISGFFVTTPLLVLAYLIFVSLALCLIIIDFKHFLLPDELTISLLWCGLLVNLHGALSWSLQNAVIGVVLGYMLLWLIYWLVVLLFKKQGMGYGDFKFLAAILAWFGWQWLLVLLFVAPLMGICYYIIGRFGGVLSKGAYIPFGSCLGVTAIMLLFVHNSTLFSSLLLLPLLNF